QERHADVGAGRLLHLFHGMPFDDVADLVTQNAGQLIQPFRALDETAIHVDEATRQRERIHVTAVHDEELPVEVRAARLARDLATERAHIAHYFLLGDT